MSDVDFKDNLAITLQDDKIALRFVRNRWERMKTARQPFEAAWKVYYKLYRGYPDPKFQDWKANLFVPRTFEICETILPRLVQAIFSVRPSVSMLPIPSREDLALGDAALAALAERAHTAEMVLDQQIENEIKLRKQFQRTWARECVIYGSAPGILTWNDETNQPRFQPIDIFDWWCDPRAEEIRDAQYACHRIRLTIDEVRQRAEEGIYNQEAVDKLQAATDPSWPALERLKELRRGAGYQMGETEDRMVELIEFWRRDRVITTDVNFNAILRNQPNELYGGKCLPYILMKFNPVPHELYGIGIPEMLQSLQLELNDTRNLRIDNAKLAMCKLFAVPSDWDDEANYIFPGATFKLSDPQSFRAIDIPDLSQGALGEEERILKDMDRVVGTYDYTRGSAARANETATGINIIVQEGNVRFAMYVSISEDAVLELVEKLYVLDQLHLQLPTVVRVTNETGVAYHPVSEDVFSGSYDILPVTSSTLGNKDIQRQQVTGLVQLLMQVPPFAQFTDWAKLLRVVMSKFEMRDAAGVMKSGAEVQEEQQEQQWIAQAAQVLQLMAQMGNPAAQQLLQSVPASPMGAPAGQAPSAPGAGPSPLSAPGGGSPATAGNRPRLMGAVA